MARRPRASKLETRTARLKLPVRRKPHEFTTISPDIALGYRRNRDAGTWVVRVADGKGGNWTKRVGTADDFEDANGADILTWWEAIDKARKLARGSDADAGRPITVAEAIDNYERDLVARGRQGFNASRLRRYIPATLAAKPVGLLVANELTTWRNGLFETVKQPTVVRLCRPMKAALNLAARCDRRINNRTEWKDGLSGITEDYDSRNVQRLTDDEVRAVIAAAYEVDPAFGLYVETAATTGARSSQIARLVVGDLQDGSNPRLMMPASRKGKRANAPAKRPVSITVELAHKLASNRPVDAPLLLRADGRAWQSGNKDDHFRLYAQAAKRAGVVGSIYQLRHSSVIRQLIGGVPTRVVAAAHDTSVTMLERTYSAFISDYSDELTRKALLDVAPPAGKVVSIGGR